MMSAFVAFLLVVTIFIGILAVIFDPTRSIVKYMEGKTAEQLKKEIDLEDEKKLASCMAMAAKLGCFMVVAVLLNFVFEPFFIIYGLVNKLGNSTFAYVALGIVALYWYLNVKASIPRKGKNKTAVRTESGEVVEGDVVSELHKVNWTKVYLRKAFFLIPEVYLIYLFLVGIGVFPGQ